MDVWTFVTESLENGLSEIEEDEHRNRLKTIIYYKTKLNLT